MNQDYQALLREDPGNPAFPAYAESLINQGKPLEALEVCLAGLSVNPTCHKGKLLLARIYFERSYIPFAVRELQELRLALPDNKYITRLLERLAPESLLNLGKPPTGTSAEMTLAETDLEAGDIEILLNDEEKDS